MSNAVNINPNLPPPHAALFQAKARLGLTFEQIGKEIGKDEVWTAAAFYGQAKFDSEDLIKLSQVLSLPDLRLEIGDGWFPHRGALAQMPPSDPTLYRLYEDMMVYGYPIKAILHEKFGDGIMSMVGCKVHIDKKETPQGVRAILTFDGKFLPYAKW